MPESSGRGQEFQVSTFSGGGNCVAVRTGSDGRVVVRHSTDPHRELVFTTEEWAAFVLGVKAGEFDPAV